MSISKYVKGGSINPQWVMQQRENYENEIRMDQIAFSNLELQMKLETVYNFIKSHNITNIGFIDMIKIIK